MAQHQRDRWRARDEGMTQGGFGAAPHRAQTRRIVQDLAAPSSPGTLVPPQTLYQHVGSHDHDGWSATFTIPGPGVVFWSVDATSPDGPIEDPYVLQMTGYTFPAHPVAFAPANLAAADSRVTGQLTEVGLPHLAEMSAVVLNQADGSKFTGRTFHFIVSVGFLPYP